MPDIVSIVQNGLANPWLYLPLALLLGALHALEPGHAKSVMAAFIIAIRGTAAQAVLLGLSAAIGHSLVVWGLAILGLTLGDRYIVDTAMPWLILATGILILMLSFRLYRMGARMGSSCGHDHGAHDGHHHPDPAEKFANRNVTNLDIAWFGFTGGLMPCPAAIAVLLICLQLKKISLGIAMVAAFSAGLAVTLVSIGVIAAWGAQHARRKWSGFEKIGGRLPYLSAALVFIMGMFFTIKGLIDTNLLPY